MPQEIPAKAGHAVVYTAIYGDYDKLKQPRAQDVPCDFICFTDNETLLGRAGLWRIIVAPRPEPHPRMQAKYYKIMSHLVFPGGQLAPCYDWPGERVNYDDVIWVDGSIDIRSPRFVREISAYVGEN